jgi:chemotaxis-related protein WspB
MLFLLIQLDEDRYLLDVRQVIEVLPLIRLTRMSQTPREVAGIFNYHGTFVPAVDLTELMLGRPSRQRLHTRLIVVSYDDEGGAKRLLGLIAERVTKTLKRASDDFSASGLALPHVGAVATDEEGLSQRIEIGQLLPASVRNLLSQQPTLSDDSQRL